METKPLTKEEILTLKVAHLMIALNDVSRSAKRLLSRARPISKSSAQSSVLISDLDDLSVNVYRADNVRWPE